MPAEPWYPWFFDQCLSQDVTSHAQVAVAVRHFSLLLEGAVVHTIYIAGLSLLSPHIFPVIYCATLLEAKCLQIIHFGEHVTSLSSPPCKPFVLSGLEVLQLVFN